MRSLKVALFSAAALALAAPAFAASAPSDQSAPAAVTAKPDTAAKTQTGKTAHHKGHHKAKAAETPAPAAK